MGRIGSPLYLYTYACHEDERPLCRLELRTLFGSEPEEAYVLSDVDLDASRSPFIKQRIAVSHEAATLSELAEEVNGVTVAEATFKVVFVETGAETTVDYDGQRQAERAIGAHIRGTAEMRRPQQLFGVAQAGGRWLFGACAANEAVWLRHKAKPQQYSTALGTRVARAVANIAVPRPEGIKAVDPCCGIGTVVIEARSMGIDMAGFDLNPLAVRGARANLAHFGMPDVVAVKDINELTGHYDAAVLDLPYNLCSVISQEELLSMLRSARALADRAVLIATDTIDQLVEQSGFTIRDRCVVRKGTFTRHILVCG
ncbi:TRM11 family SAM-dependent methyltransferase [Paenibacillus allorhizosphaerae]|uniref:Ribosomal RNA large subunit methyltransferase K/L-like methyltransferase domain-containing protein n=1 Tax=Paenibacillus allorhizosphaerae TaxID=2849866 RepID=A0ABM8VMK9_9BACL|nr:RsmD family RNA methyltransferase [Paenibacillus allorhizosphaerae]CAG7650121.1 hypothetical protein PAECIP111802_04644 [Paenibacillus allorhizosphaerae]